MVNEISVTAYRLVIFYTCAVSRLEEMPMWPALWLEHQVRDEYWKHGSVCENYEDIEVPVFAIDGWADSGL